MRRFIRSLFVCLVSFLPLLLGCGLEGVNNANPATDFRVNTRTGEVRYRNNKDVDLALPKGEYTDASGRKVVIDGLQIRSNASDVRTANYQQMLGMAYQAQVNWQGATQMVGALGQVISEIMPFVPKIVASRALGKLNSSQGVASPFGGISTTGGFSPDQVQALLSLAGSAVVPSTQPAQ